MKTYGLQTASQILGADKMIVSAINQTELRKCFGDQGQYGSLNAIIFDVTTRGFYQLMQFNSNNDAITVANWSSLPSGTVTIQNWEAKAYNKGSMVGIEDGGGNMSYYISVVNTLPGDMPPSAKWFMIPLDGGSTTMPMQLEYGTIQPSSTTLPQRTLQYTINNIVSLSSTRIPTIQILIRTIDDVWEIAYPTVQFTRSSTIKAKIIFYGDLTKLHTDSNNVAITFI